MRAPVPLFIFTFHFPRILTRLHTLLMQHRHSSCSYTKQTKWYEIPINAMNPLRYTVKHSCFISSCHLRIHSFQSTVSCISPTSKFPVVYYYHKNTQQGRRIVTNVLQTQILHQWKLCMYIRHTCPIHKSLHAHERNL